jgi:cytochrome c-type biogenesis protein CcmH
MLAAALLWILLPLVRAPASGDAAATRRERRTSSVLIAVLVPVVAVAMYSRLSNWDWKTREQEAAQVADMGNMLQQLEAKLASHPGDVTGWLLLGKSYTSLGQYPRAVHAYQQAYDHSKGENVEAIIGLGEALALSDEASLSGRAGQLFDEALAKAPHHPKALWYGSVAALRAGDLRTGRDRLQLLLAQNPPEELRTVLERQIQDLNQQLGEGGQGAQASAAGTAGAEGAKAEHRSIRVNVSIAPQVREQLKSELPLFVLARDPAGGPPLAVQRHNSAALPLTIELTERDAMMPSRSIASVPRVVVVARLSKSGAPQAQSGDFYGEADYEFAAATGTLNLVIDRTVP